MAFYGKRRFNTWKKVFIHQPQGRKVEKNQDTYQLRCDKSRSGENAKTI